MGWVLRRPTMFTHLFIKSSASWVAWLLAWGGVGLLLIVSYGLSISNGFGQFSKRLGKVWKSNVPSRPGLRRSWPIIQERRARLGN